jgi:cell division protein FtsB
MVKKKKAPFLKRLFPGSPVLRIIFVVVTLITAIVVVQNAYHYIRIRQQEAQLFQERDKLAQEKQELETKKEELEDPLLPIHTRLSAAGTGPEAASPLYHPCGYNSWK